MLAKLPGLGYVEVDEQVHGRREKQSREDRSDDRKDRRIRSVCGRVLRKTPVPFSRRQYFRYQTRLTTQGLAGLLDGRSQGNRRKITPEAEAFLQGAHESNPQRSLDELGLSLKSKLGIEVDRSTVSRFFRRIGEVIAWPRPREPERVTSLGGGFEMVAALALHLGWVQHTAQGMGRALARFRRTAIYRQERVGKDWKGRQGGRFTAAYNRGARTSASHASPRWRKNARTRTTRAWGCSKRAPSLWSGNAWGFWS